VWNDEAHLDKVPLWRKNLEPIRILFCVFVFRGVAPKNKNTSNIRIDT
jgi:hypothetical protein